MEQYMQFEEFTETVRNRITDHLPPSLKEGTIRIQPFQKIGSSYLSLTIDQKPSHSSPVVNLEEFYDAYRHDQPMEELLEQMAVQLRKDAPSLETGFLESYETIRPKLFVRLSNRHWNSDFLKTVPHQDHSDFAVTAHILFSHANGNWISTPFTRKMLDSFSVTEEQLFLDAFDNSVKLFPAVIKDMKELWKEDGDEEEEEWAKIKDRDVVTNEEQINGAVVLFYPGVLKTLTMRCHSGFYLIPTSIHEFLVEKDHEDADVQKMEEGLIRTNLAVTERKEWLSEHVYHYDPFNDALERAADYQKRIRV